MQFAHLPLCVMIADTGRASFDQPDGVEYWSDFVKGVEPNAKIVLVGNKVDLADVDGLR